MKIAMKPCERWVVAWACSPETVTEELRDEMGDGLDMIGTKAIAVMPYSSIVNQEIKKN